MKITMTAAVATVLWCGPAVAAPPASLPQPDSAYSFNLTAIDGAPLPLEQFRGKVVLLVNTASFCGYTRQYEGLQALFEQHRARGFAVIGVPSGDFAGQELPRNKEIKEFCESTFRIRFPMTEKSVVSGQNAIPLFKWAARVTGQPPAWNFHKYLIGRDGRIRASFPSKVTPQSADLTAALNAALAAPAPAARPAADQPAVPSSGASGPAPRTRKPE